MASDTDKHHELLAALKGAQGKSDGHFEQALINAFEHVFKHLEQLNTISDPDEERRLKPGEASTLR
ncbi:hypothetical protein G3T14_23020 [Methylobacterium sp. BTF04]|uniref:hypothetical protein n=1 Tax=Methylobacterium sp. BTF04 TaxID=2708300 RepID=UPI0013D3860D|nr:hypothetical protein [Methylobacterium sp. BTF04]NEU14926.1 hypothetical protein [Methylobacterium sp. BTF04]